MDDVLAYARRSATNFDETVSRLDAASRRWQESAEDARQQWDDPLGRRFQSRWLDPYREQVQGLQSAALLVVDAQRTTLLSLGQAIELAIKAGDSVATARTGLRRAESHMSSARSEISSSLAESARAHQIAADVSSRVASLA